jgi:hypothetical protein
MSAIRSRFKVPGSRFCRCVALASLLSFLSVGSFAEEVRKATRDVDVVVVLGAQGTEEYGKRFKEAADAWQGACAKAAAKFEIIGTAKDNADDAKLLEERLKAEHAKTTGALWLVFIGHGTFDGREAKFNLRGADVTPAQIAAWLKPVKREVVFIDTASASAPFAKAVAGPNRICVSATKSADEVFYARFGEFFAKAVGGLPEADVDQDRQVSVLEAFLHASKQVAEFYVTDGRLATEHAIIDDNGDGVGTRAEVFQGVVAGKTAEGSKPDGERARQVSLVLSEDDARLAEAARARRDEMERMIRALAGKKSAMKEADFYREMEKLMLELARIYDGAGVPNGPSGE